MKFKIYSHLYRVTYGDCTQGSHVYYGRYPYLLEEARGEFFRYLGTTFQDYHKKGYLFPVSEVHLKYLTPAKYDDELTIECFLTIFKGARLGFGYRIKKGSVNILEGETLHCCTDTENKVKRLPNQLKDRLNSFIKDDAT